MTSEGALGKEQKRDVIQPGILKFSHFCELLKTQIQNCILTAGIAIEVKVMLSHLVP